MSGKIEWLCVAGGLCLLAGCDVFVADRPYHRRPPEVVYRQQPTVVYQTPPPAVVYPAPQPVYPPQPTAVYPQPAPPQPGVVVTQPPPVVVQQPAPVVYEEGAVVNGVVIVEPAGVSDYVLINGGWYYWHPGLGVWVHARRAADWHPPETVHVYHSWAEHPLYGRGR